MRYVSFRCDRSRPQNSIWFVDLTTAGEDPVEGEAKLKTSCPAECPTHRVQVPAQRKSSTQADERRRYNLSGTRTRPEGARRYLRKLSRSTISRYPSGSRRMR